MKSRSKIPGRRKTDIPGEGTSSYPGCLVVALTGLARLCVDIASAAGSEFADSSTWQSLLGRERDLHCSTACLPLSRITAYPSYTPPTITPVFRPIGRSCRDDSQLRTWELSETCLLRAVARPSLAGSVTPADKRSPGLNNKFAKNKGDYR